MYGRSCRQVWTTSRCASPTAYHHAACRLPYLTPTARLTLRLSSTCLQSTKRPLIHHRQRHAIPLLYIHLTLDGGGGVGCILRAWSLSYLEHLSSNRTDQGSEFVGAEVKQWAGEAGFTLHAVAVGDPNTMSIGEQVPYPLQKTFIKLRLNYQKASGELLLGVAV